MELRDSVRFTKMRLIQQELIRHFDSFGELDEFLLPPKTKNGWSPENNELEGASKILGIDSLHYNAIMTTDNPKFTNETREDIDKFLVQEDDFFISRGNTVDLVALASIAHNLEEDYIFPDIMIKLFIDDDKIDRLFLAYLFNSIIGRLYFKYASKGKQQTMVKVSSDTIRNFVIPKISKSKQIEIVNEIKSETSKQMAIRENISKLRNQIDVIMSDAVIYETVQ
jgi:type I restriction enzyme S subunit